MKRYRTRLPVLRISESIISQYPTRQPSNRVTQKYIRRGDLFYPPFSTLLVHCTKLNMTAITLIYTRYLHNYYQVATIILVRIYSLIESRLYCVCTAKANRGWINYTYIPWLMWMYVPLLSLSKKKSVKKIIRESNRRELTKNNSIE